MVPERRFRRVSFNRSEGKETGAVAFVQINFLPATLSLNDLIGAENRSRLPDKRFRIVQADEFTDPSRDLWSFAKESKELICADIVSQK